MTTYQPPTDFLQHAPSYLTQNQCAFYETFDQNFRHHIKPLCSAVLHRSCSVLTPYLALSWVSNPDDDKLPDQRRCAGVDCCLPQDTQSNGYLYSMLTSCPICQHDKSVSYNTQQYTPITMTCLNIMKSKKPNLFKFTPKSKYTQQSRFH